MKCTADIITITLLLVVFHQCQTSEMHKKAKIQDTNGKKQVCFGCGLKIDSAEVNAEVFL